MSLVETYDRCLVLTDGDPIGASLLVLSAVLNQDRYLDDGSELDEVDEHFDVETLLD